MKITENSVIFGAAVRDTVDLDNLTDTFLFLVAFSPLFSSMITPSCLNSPPLVTAIIPAYNAEAFIERTLDSVCSQTYQNIEIIVVDDGSEDKTTQIVQSVACLDHRISLFQQANLGVAAARNLAIEKSSGEFIAPVDADDIWFPEKIERQVQCFLDSDESVGLVYSWFVSIDEQDEILGAPDLQVFLDYHSTEGNVFIPHIYRNFVGNASIPLIRRTCLDKVGAYNPKLREQNGQGCEDWDISLRIAEYYELRVVKEFLVGYRQSQGNMSSNYKSMAQSYRLIMQEVQRNHPEIPNYIFRWSDSHFCGYLSGKSWASGDYWSTLLFLYQSVVSDFAALLRPGFYKMLLLSLLMLLTQAIPAKTIVDRHSLANLEAKRSPIDRRSYRKIFQKAKNFSISNQAQPLALKQKLKRHFNITKRRWLWLVQQTRTSFG